MTQKLIKLLKEEIEKFEMAVNTLSYSFNQCIGINLNANLNEKELVELEALTSRFARVSDLFIQKILRLIDEIDLEAKGTVRDRINRAEKKEIIKDAEEFSIMRRLRNEISHEYSNEEILEIFKLVIKYTPKLLASFDGVQTYISKHY